VTWRESLRILFRCEQRKMVSVDSDRAAYFFRRLDRAKPCDRTSPRFFRPADKSKLNYSQEGMLNCLNGAAFQRHSRWSPLTRYLAEISSMPFVKAPHAEPIVGYRLLEPLGKGGVGEVWKCEAPGGLHKAIKFIAEGEDPAASQSTGAQREHRALQLIKAIRHPFLLSIERIEHLEGELAVVMELADRCLHDLLIEHHGRGHAGIARAELLAYLREAAEALDLLNLEYGLQHLDVKPRNLFLIGRHVKVADFGLMASLSDLQDRETWKLRSEALTPLYAAPEIFLGRFTLYSDQYSLAIAYHELLTGVPPFTATSFRQMALQHVQQAPNLERLAEADRPIVARALAKEPRERFPSCGAFVQALTAQSETAAPLRKRRAGAKAERAKERSATVSSTAASKVAIERGGATEIFLAGYRLWECLQHHAGGELWTAQTGDGRKRLVRILNGIEIDEQCSEVDPLVRLRQLRHPILTRYELLKGSAGQVALIADAPDSSLGEQLRQQQQINKGGGLPRPQLLMHLRQIAEGLDDLFQDYQLRHLSLTPRNIVLNGGRLYLLDFGLAELLWLPAKHNLATLNPRYAAPELFDFQVSRFADQYSLALIYHELLTGIPAFRTSNARQITVARQRGQADLSLLPAGDRAVIAQALQLDPERRFPSCAALIEALDSLSTPRPPSSHDTDVRVATLAEPSLFHSQVLRGTLEAKTPWNCSVEEAKQSIADQVLEAAAGRDIYTRSSLRYLVLRQRAHSSLATIDYVAYGRIVSSTMALKVEGFESDWKLQRLPTPKDSLNASEGRKVLGSWLYRFSFSRGLWQRCTGRTPSLLLQIELAMPRFGSQGVTEVRVRVRPCDCNSDKEREIVEEITPHLVRSLRDYLQLMPEQRGEERFAWASQASMQPILGPDELGAALEAQVRDIGIGGLALEIACRPPSELFLLHMNLRQRSSLVLPFQVLHTNRLDDGRHFVGGRFAWELMEPEA
jgi:serine/threonine protein kinase